jgi:hypothetical protein
MLSDEKLINLDKFIVKPGTSITLSDYDTDYTGEALSKKVKRTRTRF